MRTGLKLDWAHLHSLYIVWQSVSIALYSPSMSSSVLVLHMCEILSSGSTRPNLSTLALNLIPHYKNGKI